MHTPGSHQTAKGRLYEVDADYPENLRDFLKRFFNYLIVKFSISKVFVHTSINAYSVPKANYDARSSWDQLKETQREQQPQNVEHRKKRRTGRGRDNGNLQLLPLCICVY